MKYSIEAVKEEAAAIKVGVAGSELVGLVPLEAMLKAADYYIEKENLFILEEAQKIKLVVDRLGLNSVSQFKPEERIIDYLIKEERKEPLAGLTTRGFIEAINARTSAPGLTLYDAMFTTLPSTTMCLWRTS